MTSKPTRTVPPVDNAYGMILVDIAGMIAAARNVTARSVNCFMTATYWLIGRRVVEFEQKGETRAAYGVALLRRLSGDLSKRFGRGFGVDNLQRFRAFYLAHPANEIYATVSRISADGEIPEKEQTPSAQSDITVLAQRFPLPWSAYVRLLAVKSEHARRFYESEALQGGWSVRQEA